MTETTISRFCDDTIHIGATFLVNVTGHFVATHKGLICDTYTDGEIIPIANYRKPQWRTQRAWKIEAPGTPRYTVDDPIIRARPPKPPRDLKAERHADVIARIKKWEAKRKRAETALKGLRRKLAYYERQTRPVSTRISSTTTSSPTTPEGP